MLPFSVDNNTLGARQVTVVLADNSLCPVSRALLDIFTGSFPLLPKTMISMLGSLYLRHPIEDMVKKNKHNYYWL